MVDYSGRKLGIQNDEADSLLELFHEATKFHPAAFRPTLHNLPPTLIRRMSDSYKEYSCAETIELTRTTLDTADFWTLLNTRRSNRNFDGPSSISLEQLSTILRSAASITSGREVVLKDGTTARQEFRTAPSGGALYPIEVYAAVLSSSDIQEGSYHYSVRDESLERLPTDSRQPEPYVNRIQRALCEFDLVPKCSCVIILSAVFRRTTSKYGTRGYRYVLLEAGSILQNVLFASTALRIPSLPYAGFVDDFLHEELGLDGLNEAALCTILLGEGT